MQMKRFCAYCDCMVDVLKIDPKNNRKLSNPASDGNNAKVHLAKYSMDILVHDCNLNLLMYVIVNINSITK